MYHPVNLVKFRRIVSEYIFVCISGHGVDKLLDDNLETYWQSDGPQPHLVNIQFKQKTKVKDLCIFSDFKVDESYTPQK
jgi:anaphase-promoting complex subunit 10